MSTPHEPTIVIEVKKILKPLIPEFLANRRQDVILLREAVGQADHESIRRIGHNLKGLGLSYGFLTLTDLGVVIEKAALANDTERIKVETESLSNYLSRIDVVFR